MSAFKIKKGWAVNPLTVGHARNLTCPCGTKKKAKKCCGTVRLVKIETAAKITKWIAGAINIPREEMEMIMEKQLQLKAKLKDDKKIGEV